MISVQRKQGHLTVSVSVQVVLEVKLSGNIGACNEGDEVEEVTVVERLSREIAAAHKGYDAVRLDLTELSTWDENAGLAICALRQACDGRTDVVLDRGGRHVKGCVNKGLVLGVGECLPAAN
jgi:hypothetical protein